MDYSIETTGYFFNCVRNFTEGSTVASSLYSHFQQVAVVTGFCCAGNSFQIACNSVVVAFCSQFFQTFNLSVTYSGVIDGQYVQRIFLSQTIFVQANDGFFTAIDVSLATSCALFDTHFRQAGCNSFCHTTECFNFLDMSPSTANDFVGEVFNIVGTAPRIDNLADFGFILDVQLGVTSKTSGEVGRQCDSFVQCVCMQGLGMAQSSRHSFHTSTGDVVERILFGQRPAGSLAVSTQCHGFRVLSAEALKNLSPQNTSSTHFCNFHEVVFAHIPEEGQTFCECVYRQARSFTGTDIFHTIGQSVA